MDSESAKKTFFIEADDMLHEMEKHLLVLEDNYSDDEAINAIFRAVHTIKGSSGMFGLNLIMEFTHVVENILDNLRQKKIQNSEKLLALFLSCHDHIADLLNYCQNNECSELNSELNQQGADLVSQLKLYQTVIESANLKISSEEKDEPSAIVENSIQSVDDELIDRSNVAIDESKNVLNKYWHISLRPVKEIFQHGYDPYSFIVYLKKYGIIRNLTIVGNDLPILADLNPELCYLGYEIDFESDVSKDEIIAVFDFIADDCVIKILPPHSKINEYLKMLHELPGEPLMLGELLVRIGTLTPLELGEAILLQSKGDLSDEIAPKKLLGEIITKEKMVQPAVINAAIVKQQIAKDAENFIQSSIRVDAQKLDRLINLVGELVISGANVNQQAVQYGLTDLTESMSQMSRLIDEIRNSALNVRMIPVAETFSRYKRVVRDLSKELGKEIELVINGGDTEMDKTLIEKISDPLMHLIRNSIDHGIDIPAERIAKGKPAKGTITLNAYYETGSIVIEVKDDGNGLRSDKIRSKAIERQLLREDQVVTDEELYQYIFEPGFSTAEAVTSISGRGVGMDVVKRNVKALRGTISLYSENGVGTSVKIQLPLTLAIIDGFRVEVDSQSYVIPLDMIKECIEINQLTIEEKAGGNFFNLRGDVLPYVRLRDFFKAEKSTQEMENIVIVEYAQHKAGLVVDRLLGEFQTVIKPLGRIYNNLQWLNGATILGTGDVALILDIPMLIQNLK